MMLCNLRFIDFNKECFKIILRSRYDGKYDAISSGRLFRRYKPGAVFEIGGEK